MKWIARSALVIGTILGLAFMYWWLRIRQVPTLRLSYTVGRGRDVGIEWIDLKQISRDQS